MVLLGLERDTSTPSAKLTIDLIFMLWEGYSLPFSFSGMYFSENSIQIFQHDEIEVLSWQSTLVS